MSRFIPEGKSDLKALQANENKASSKFHEEEEEKEALSLYEQMKLNHMQKEQEYQEKVKARNQPHKIDEREHAYYEGLRFKEQEKESLRKRELEQGVEEFEKTKAETPVEKESIDITELALPSTKITRKKLTKKPIMAKQRDNSSSPTNSEPSKDTQKEKPVTNALISGYSSESDSE
ncbi:hypothetical protein BON22_1950 [Cyberlindnera fabianii]|uniref:FAM192A/Fyv6 N-terminal domain-containing protein n=2 Tax=Cyberlindnera fabianii TaxID=36022 RepID=A0A1V2L8R0_CYBFA|nr:hypothetical protein BON22_1950 [Cyberlindnera fabianii]